MRKKKNEQVFKQGMKAGAAPFEKKFEKTAEAIYKTSGHIDQIARNQRKTKDMIDDMIVGQQEDHERLNVLNKTSQKAEKEISKYKGKSRAMELKMKSLSTVCKKCGHHMAAHQLVCSYCGAITESFPYIPDDFRIKKECLEEAKELSNTVIDADSKNDDWLYPELNEKFIKMKKIKEIASKAMKDKAGGNTAYYRKVNELAQKFFSDYKKKKIEIAVVGTVKAGKSSLINALIGARLASVGAIPETSILAKYRTTSDKNYIKITFYTENQWNKLWESAKTAKVFKGDYDRLGAEKIKYEYLGKPEKYIVCSSEELPLLMMEWSKSDAPKHFFVKEIEVGYKSDTFPHDVFLVDTPGLSDPVKYRSDITRKYIKNSDWILACIMGANLSGQPEFKFLSDVIANKNYDVSKVFVVATQRDTLTNEEAQEKANEFLIRMGQIYRNDSLAISRFSFVAAEMHLMTLQILNGINLEKEEKKKLRKGLLEIDEDFELSNVATQSDEVFKYAGVNDLYNRIDKTVLQNTRELILKAILDDYYNCMRLINDHMSSGLDDAETLLEKISKKQEEDQNTIEELKESNAELESLLYEVKKIKTTLEARIKANEEMYAVSEHKM